MFEGDEISSCSYMEGSITPPLSPKSLEDVNSPASKRQRVELFTDITAEDFTKSSVSFHCNKRGTGTSPWQPVSMWKPASDSYLASGSLSLTLRGDDPSDGSFLDLLTDLYGYKHVTASALFQQTKILFYLTRQKLSEFRRLTESKPFVQVGTGGVNSQVQWLHSQCCHVLQYVKVVIYRYYDPALALDPIQTLIEHFRNISEFPTSFLHHMGGLINHLGSLYVIQKKSLSKDLLHLHLDFHWSVVEILHIFHIKVKDLAVQSEVCQLFNTHLKTLLWDLVLIANTNHKNISSYQFHQSSIFPCHCFQELWILLLHLLDNRHQQLDTESFWCHIYSILHTVLSRQIPEEVSQHGVPTDSLESVDVQGLCWWLVLHMAPLYQYNEFGQITTNQTSVKNNWLMIQDLWKTAFSQDAIPEEGKVRCYLKCCIALSSYWDHNLIFVGTILERFHRRLNDTFHIPSLGLQDFTTNTKKTGGQWFEECFYRCKENDDDHLKIFNEKVNSYGLFLHLLALQLRKGMKAIGSKAWKQLKGRICSKFHQRGMQELSEIGMGHFMDLFLTLSMVVDVKEVGSRLCDFLDMLPSNNISPRKQIVIWKGLFALILNYEDKLVDIKGPAQKLAAQFNKISKEFSQLEGDPTRRHQYWELLNTYMEGLQEIFERSTYLNLSEDELIGDGFLHFLPVCKEYELQAALSCIQTLLVQHRSVSKRVQSLSDGLDSATLQLQHKAIAAALWKNTYPFVKTHSTTATAPSQLADIAVNLTLLALDTGDVKDPSIPSFISLVQYFGLQDTQVNASVCCQYLYHLLQNQNVMAKIQDDIGADYQWQIIHAWFRCALLMFKPSDQMQNLTRFLWKVPEFADLINITGETIDEEASIEDVLCYFLKTIRRGFNQVKTFQERVSFRDKVYLYFGDIVKYINPTLKAAGPQNALNWIYSVCGHIVKFTAKIIYVQGKPQCLLPAILDSLVVPHALFNPNKTLPASQVTAIREHLHLFLDGLAELDYKRDPYLQRRMKDVVTQYFNRFQMKSTGSANIGASVTCSTNHPFLTTLQSSDEASEQMRNFQVFLLEQICSIHLVPRKNRLTPVITNSLVFLKEFYRRASVQDSARSVSLVFGSLLDILLIAESSSVSNVKKPAIVVLQAALDAYQQVPHLVPREKLDMSLRVFIIKHFRTAHVYVLRVLEAVSVMCKDVVVNVLPKLLDEVYQMEMKRGVGRDSNLRRAVRKLLETFGEAGENFISHLEEPSPNFCISSVEDKL